MNKIEKFLDSVYTDFDCKNKEIQDLKNEMRVHIFESVAELKKQGHTEDESINIALASFGDDIELDAEISDLFAYKNNEFKFILGSIFIFMTILTIYTKFFSGMTMVDYKLVFMPIIIIPIYIIYKITMIFRYNKKSIKINIKSEFLKTIISLYIILSINYLIFPLNFDSGYMKAPFINMVPTYISYAIPSILYVGIIFFLFGVFSPFIIKRANSLIKVIICSIGVFTILCIIKLIYALIGSRIAINIFQIVGVIIGASLGYLCHMKYVERFNGM